MQSSMHLLWTGPCRGGVGGVSPRARTFPGGPGCGMTIKKRLFWRAWAAFPPGPVISLHSPGYGLLENSSTARKAFFLTGLMCILTFAIGSAKKHPRNLRTFTLCYDQLIKLTKMTLNKQMYFCAQKLCCLYFSGKISPLCLTTNCPLSPFPSRRLDS